MNNLPSLRAHPRWNRAGMRAILAEVAAKHRVPADVVAGPCLLRKVTRARQEAYWRIRRELGQSLPQVGAFFGRDHSTVLFGERRHAERMVCDPARGSGITVTPQWAALGAPVPNEIKTGTDHQPDAAEEWRKSPNSFAASGDIVSIGRS